MAKLGPKQKIQKFNAESGKLDAKDPDSSDNALPSAAWAREVEILRILLDAGMDVNSTNNYLRTTLHLYAIRGLAEGTKLLIRHDAKLDEEDLWGVTALMIARDRCHFAMAMELIEAGAKINTLVNPIQPTFFTAVQLGNFKAVKRLIAHGADLLTLDFNGYTALQLAKMRDQPEVMEILRQHKLFYVPSRTVPEQSEGSLAISPPAYPNITVEPFEPRPIVKR